MIIFTQTGEFEKDINSATDIIEVFDNMTDKPLFLNHIWANLGYWGEDNPDRINEENYKYERLAYGLMEGHNQDAWDTFYGPMFHIPQLDGSYMDKPRLDEITPEVISYWESRGSVVKNPAIKMHYMGLVYSFKEKITNTPCDNTFLESYVKTIVESSTNGWVVDYKSAKTFLPIAFEIAIKLPHLIQDVKNEILRLAQSAKDNQLGVWLACYNLLIQYFKDKNLFNKQEKTDIINYIETRFSSLICKSPNAEGDEKLNPFFVRDIAFVLAQYYKQNNNTVDKERVIHEIDSAFRKILNQGVVMQQLFWLEEIQKCYSTFGMTTDAQSMYPEIQAKGIEVKDSLEQRIHEYSIPSELVERLKNEIINGSVDEIYTHFVEKFTLKKKAAEEFVEKQKINPLSGMMGIQILSESGMPLSQIGTPEFDREGNEYSFGAELIVSYSPILRYVISELVNSGIFTEDLIVKHIMASNLINYDRKDSIAKGIRFYMCGEYVTACHLLIPQIEHGICNLALKLGANALRMQPSGKGYMVQLMDKLFDVPEVHDLLGEDQSFYLRTLLTEQRGLNLRNLLCHGLINPNFFDITKADRIIHALLLIGNLKVNEAVL